MQAVPIPQADASGSRQVVPGTETNAGLGATTPLVTTSPRGVPSDPASQSAAPPLEQALLAGGRKQVLQIC